LTIIVQASERLSLEQIQVFLEGSGEAGFKGQNREERSGDEETAPAGLLQRR
jgi:hypothetical protein